MVRQRVGDGVVVAALVVGSASAWLTWTQSGSANRDSYGSLRAAQRLGIEQLTPFRVVWFCVPIVALAVVILLVVGFRRSGLGLAVLAGLTLLAFGGGMLLTPVASGLGPWVACICGVVVLVFSGLLFAQGGARR